MKNNVIDAFKAFEIKNLQKISGGLRYAASGGGTNPDGSTYVDYQIQNDDRTPTGGYKCGVPDGTLPQGGVISGGSEPATSGQTSSAIGND
jgi:hypothetical protein